MLTSKHAKRRTKINPMQAYHFPSAAQGHLKPYFWKMLLMANCFRMRHNIIKTQRAGNLWPRVCWSVKKLKLLTKYFTKFKL